MSKEDCPGSGRPVLAGLFDHKMTCPVCGGYIRINSSNQLYKHKPRKGKE